MTAIATATPPRARKLVGAGRRQWIGLLYVAPAVALVVVFFVIPLGMTAWMSLHNWPLMGEHCYIGLDNYWAILRDNRFWNALQLHRLLHGDRHHRDLRASPFRWRCSSKSRGR